MAGVDLNAKVGVILLSDWDPIGIRDVPQTADEYDAYAAPVARMIAEERSEAELTAYLLEIETEIFGLVGDTERARRVAAKLRSII